MEKYAFPSGNRAFNDENTSGGLEPPDTVQQVKQICRVIMSNDALVKRLRKTNDYKNLKKIWGACNGQWRTHPWRKEPASCRLWLRSYLLTFEIPNSTTDSKRRPGGKTIRKLLGFIELSLNIVFSQDGKYVISLYPYGHWGTDSRYPRLHFHVALAVYLLPTAAKRWRKDGSDIKVWSKMPEGLGKLSKVKELVGPDIVMDDTTLDALNAHWREKLQAIFGQDCWAEDERPVWSSGIITGHEACRRVALYQKNNARRAMADKKIRYKAQKRTVKMWHHSEDGSETRPCEFPVLQFAKRFLLIPMRGFKGSRFGAKGGWNGNSGFKPLLEYMRDNPAAWKATSWPKQSTEPPNMRSILEDIVTRDFPTDSYRPGDSHTELSRK